MESTVVLDRLECGTHGCGIHFAIPKYLHKKMLDEGVKIFCPNGHHISYCESELERVKKQLARQLEVTADVARSRDAWKRTADKSTRSARAIKGHHNRVMKRVHSGVCPHCNRTFRQLARHMQSKHPVVKEVS